MQEHDQIGSHGEFVFQALISRRCRGRFYFHPLHMGEKHPTADMLVEALDCPGIQANFYVQVKSTTKGYSGAGVLEKLNVSVGRADLRGYPGCNYCLVTSYALFAIVYAIRFPLFFRGWPLGSAITNMA